MSETAQEPPKRTPTKETVDAARSVLAETARAAESAVKAVAPAIREVGTELKKAGDAGLREMETLGSQASGSQDPLEAGAGKAVALAAKGTRKVAKVGIGVSKELGKAAKKGLEKAKGADQPSS
ncbi:MAG: hypothetical protein KGJ23_09555 [Euryarchaeota archaeon]|nr:hypothetical protein [Euryarchaeota archaeon]MDE1836848.1 hypothetical protein [Euryarchaeota archaeon]MDE1879727.1 hypothetical protein [Euryarchaeota archaeon]MDE2046050.1 hypothetical protein [Thermoplasmata archaeon]